MRDELYIDGNLMHVEGNIVLNRQVGKAADMGAILQGYSYTVQLPKTPENLFNIGFSHIPNVDTVYPHSEHPATLIREGITLFDDGVALIKSVGETIEVQLTWGINKRLNALGNMKLKELPVSDYMKWNKDFRQSETDYLKWVCKLDNEPRYQFIHHMRPAVKVSWLFDAICGDHVMNSSYRAEIEKLWMMLPSTKGDEIIASRLKFNLSGQAMSNDMLGNFPHIKLNTIYTQYSYDLRFMLGDTNAEPHFVRLPLGGRYRIKGTVTPVNPGSGSSFLFGLASKDKVVAKEKPTFDLTENFKPNQTIFDEYIFVAENQDVMFGITDIVNIGSFSINLAITYEPEKAQDYANTNYLLDYPIKENLPDITCVQFVKSVMALFGLYSQHVEGVLTFFSVDDILGNKEQAIDLTDQLISNSDKLEYSLGLTQNNALKWAEDDLVEKGYGDHTFSADTYEKAENVVFQQPYAATKDRCILYAKDAQGEYELLKTEKPRLLSLAGTETWLAIGLQPQFPSTQSTFSTFTFEPLKYSTLYGKYWQGYNGVFATQPRVCTRKAYFSSLFVQKLDFSIPVYAEGNYYMLVSVRNYQQSGLAELELALIDGVEVQLGAKLTNTLLESAGVPIKFEASKMALYQRTGSETDGKLIRELDESLEVTATSMFAVDNGSGPAKKVSASKVAEYIGKNHTHEISDVNQLKTELERRLLKAVFDDNFSVSDALIEALKDLKINGSGEFMGNLIVKDEAVTYSLDGIQLPYMAASSEYLNDLLDVTISNPLVNQYLKYNGDIWINSKISYADLIDTPSIPAWALAATKPSYNWSEINSKPESFPPAQHNHNWDDIANKPIEFNPTAHTHNKSEVGLGNVDNTSDANKPVSEATAKELLKKLDKIIFDENFKITDALVEVLRSLKVNGNEEVVGNLKVKGETTTYSLDGVETSSSSISGAQYLWELADVADTVKDAADGSMLVKSGSQWQHVETVSIDCGNYKIV